MSLSVLSFKLYDNLNASWHLKLMFLEVSATFKSSWALINEMIVFCPFWKVTARTSMGLIAISASIQII